MEKLVIDFFKPHTPPGDTGLGFRNYGRNRRSPEHPLHIDDYLQRPKPLDQTTAHELVHG